MTKKPEDKEIAAQGFRVQIILGVIAMLSAVTVAVITNWDKIFPGNPAIVSSESVPAIETEPRADAAPGALPAPIPKVENCDVTVKTPRADYFFVVGWEPVADSATYSVEYDCFGCREAGREWYSLRTGFPWHLRTGLGLRTPIYSSKIHNQLKEQGGFALRWRVWAVDHTGVDGEKSAWCKISFSGTPEQ